MRTEPLPLRLNPALLREQAAVLWRAAWAGVLALAAASAWASEQPAVLTMLEGEATLIIGARVYTAARGARVPAGALVETDAKTGLLRLEWADGSALDLGPGTRVMVRPALARSAGASARAARFYLLQGWAKHSQSTDSGGQLSAAFEVAPFKGVMLSQVDEAQAVLFSEAGGASFTARRGGGNASTLRAGEAATIAGTAAPQLMPRPAAAWLQQVPRAFRETLPLRAAQFTSSPAPALQPRAALNYASLQPWLSAEPALRRAFPARFAELLSDRNFKEAVNSRLKHHPEWEPVLRPPPRPGASARKNPADPEPPR